MTDKVGHFWPVTLGGPICHVLRGSLARCRLAHLQVARMRWACVGAYKRQ